MARNRRPKLSNRELEEKIDDVYEYINDIIDEQARTLTRHVDDMHIKQDLLDRIAELEEQNSALKKD